MIRTSICCDNVYHYIAFEYILKKYAQISVVTQNYVETDFSKIECMIIMLDEQNFSDCIKMYYTTLVFNTHLNIVLVGQKDVINIFRALTGKKINAIDISINVDDLIIWLIIFIYKPSSLDVIPQYNIITINELETIRLLSNGLSVTQIAKHKKKNIKTISYYKCCFFRKLGLKNSTINLFKLTRSNS